MACAQAITGVADGRCRPVAPGADPDGDCADEGATSCGNTGQCDGAGACERYGTTAICQAAQCQGTTLINAKTCDGQGTCVDRGSMACGAFICDDGACQTSCLVDSECASTSWCKSNACVAKQGDGAQCNGGNECLSNKCVDGVCCNSDCAGTCEACSATLKGGGTDGTCGPIAANSDPGDECGDSGAASCGTSGACNGMGACALYPASTQCAAPSCNGTVLTRADTCNGSGTCLDNGTLNCSPFQCANGACLNTCSTDSHCASGNYCGGNACVAKKANGGSCSGDNQCSSGFCVDGVCCNNACTGTCRACSAAKKGAGADGTCGNIGSGGDPDNECATQAASTCGTTGVCNGSAACALYSNNTVCEAASCSGSTLLLADMCNGSGTCVNGGSQSCGDYACVNNACRTNCTTSSHCASGFVCAGNVCKRSLGASCLTASQCASGFCRDGVCCESSCNGECVRCNTSGQCVGVYIGGDDSCAGSCCGPNQCVSGTQVCP